MIADNIPFGMKKLLLLAEPVFQFFSLEVQQIYINGKNLCNKK